jgi:hypothetical protein
VTIKNKIPKSHKEISNQTCKKKMAAALARFLQRRFLSTQSLHFDRSIVQGITFFFATNLGFRYCPTISHNSLSKLVNLPRMMLFRVSLFVITFINNNIDKP